jgi:hypothetical protein
MGLIDPEWLCTSTHHRQEKQSMKRSLRVLYRGFPTMAEARTEVYVHHNSIFCGSRADEVPTAEYTRNLDSKVYSKLYQSSEKHQRRQKWRG